MSEAEETLEFQTEIIFTNAEGYVEDAKVLVKYWRGIRHGRRWEEDPNVREVIRLDNRQDISSYLFEKQEDCFHELTRQAREDQLEE